MAVVCVAAAAVADNRLRQGDTAFLFFVILCSMKKLIVILVLLVIALGAAIWYLKFVGVTHEEIYEAVTDESLRIQSAVDDRYQKLDRKLDRIEGKLDKLLGIANRPLPDGMRRAE